MQQYRVCSSVCTPTSVRQVLPSVLYVGTDASKCPEQANKASLWPLNPPSMQRNALLKYSLLHKPCNPLQPEDISWRAIAWSRKISPPCCIADCGRNYCQRAWGLRIQGTYRVRTEHRAESTEDRERSTDQEKLHEPRYLTYNTFSLQARAIQFFPSFERFGRMLRFYSVFLWWYTWPVHLLNLLMNKQFPNLTPLRFIWRSSWPMFLHHLACVKSRWGCLSCFWHPTPQPRCLAQPVTKMIQYTSFISSRRGGASVGWKSRLLFKLKVDLRDQFE